MSELTTTIHPAGASILIVEDEFQLRRLTMLLLQTNGYRVRGAANGDDALQQLKAQAADLILLDYQMPGLDGPGFLAEARASGITTPVILVTASPEARALNTQFGCKGVIPKPFGAEVLLDAVRTVLARRAVPADRGISDNVSQYRYL